MANLKVGSSECSRTLVIHTLFSGSTNSELVKNWRIVASTLGVPSEDTEPLRMRYSNGTLPIKELYEDVLTLWTGVKQDAATISALITALETHETLRDAAGLLRAKFLRESSSNEGSGTGGSKTSSTETMDDKRIRHITRNQERLSKVTMLRIGILTKLLSSGYFSDEDLETLIVSNNSSDNVFKFYSLLKTRIEAYDTVIAAFNDSCQVKVAEILKEVYDS